MKTKFKINFRLLSLIICVSLVCSFRPEAYAQNLELYAGVAQVDITPVQTGYPHYRGPSTGVHDPLYAKAVVLSQGNQRIAIVVCDLLWIERELSSRVRLLAAERTGISPSNIVIAATHTHTSPAYHANIRELTGLLRPPFDEDEDLEKDEYAALLIQKITKAIEDANNSSTRVVIERATGLVDDLPYNRRYVMLNGKVQTNPGMGNPGIVRPSGPVDPEMEIVLFRRASDHAPLGALTNFSLHADTFGGTAFSADYPGFLARTLVDKFGRNFVSIFAAGPCGDINHVDAIGKKRPSSEEIGVKLGKVVLHQMRNLKPLERISVSGLTEYVYAPCQEFSAEELVWAHSEEGAPMYNDTKFLERRRRLKIRSLERLRRTEAVPPTTSGLQWKLPLEVQVFQISRDLAIVGLPGEVFVELGLAIKARSPFKTTLVIELTNSHIAYVPTREAFSQGGYETINSRLAPGGGEMMVESAVRLLNELYSNE